MIKIFNVHDKSLKILNELCLYFYKHNMNDLAIKLTNEVTSFSITISGEFEQIPVDLGELRSGLASCKQPEVENYYWELLGTNNSRHDYNILGSLTDEAHVNVEDGELTIKVHIKI